MPASVAQQIEQLALRVHRRRILIATCWALVVVAVGLTLLVVVDWTLATESHVWRLMLFAISICLVTAVLRWWQKNTTTGRQSPLALALRIEQQHPELGEMMASALDFARQEADDPVAGSESLRRAVVLQANLASDRIDWHALLPAQPLARAARALGLVAMSVAALGFCCPGLLTIGSQRLFLPLASVHWPREHNLSFVDPPRTLLSGQDLVLQLRDEAASLPEDTLVLFRTRSGEDTTEQSLPPNSKGELSTVTVNAVQRSLQFRATGGDHHSMPWQSVEVIAPPRVESMQVRVTPPSYTGLAATDWQPARRILEGSTVTVTASFDRRIEAASLNHQGGRKIPAEVDTTGQEAVFRFDVENTDASGTYILEMRTSDQLTACDVKTLTLDVVSDQPPTVHVQEPAEQVLTVAAQAVLDMSIAARDDLGLDSLELVVRRTDNTGPDEYLRELWNSSDNQATKVVELSQQLSLSDFEVSVGTRCEVSVRATDRLPQTGLTLEPLRLQIVSEQQLLQQLFEMEQRLQSVLGRALQQQRGLLQSAEVLLESENPSGTHTFHSLLFGQRQVERTLDGSPSSASQLAGQMLRTIKRNRLAVAELSSRLEEVVESVSELRSGPLPKVVESLSAAVRLGEVQQERPDLSQFEEYLSRATNGQREVIAVLQRLLGSVTDGTDVGQLAVEFREIADAQREMAADSGELLQQWLSKPQESVSRSTQQSAATQKQLARRLNNLSERMQSNARQLASRQPQLAKKLDQVCKACQKARISNTMYSAADALGNSQLGRALSLQRRSADDLQRASELLSQQDDQLAGDQSKQQPDSNSSANKRPTNQAGNRPAPGAEAATDAAVDRADTDLAVSELVGKLWGHLPQRQRQQILQPLREEFLPEYAEDIETYFRELAERDVEKGQMP